MITNRDRRAKYSPKQNDNYAGEVVDFKFSIEVLNYFCSYILSENRNIKRADLSLLRELMGRTDKDAYTMEPEKYNRIRFIINGLEARLDKSLTDSNMIFTHIQNKLGLPCTDGIRESAELNNYEVEWLNEFIRSKLKAAHVIKYKNKISDIINKIDSVDISEIEPLTAEFEILIQDAHNDIRKARIRSSSEMRFSLDESVMKDSVFQAHSELLCPANKLLCGLAGINEMTNGGFESGRTYIFFGLPADGKSATLLDMAYQIKLYNKGYKTKDPTKRPCVVFLTMENTVRETIERLFSMSVSDELMTNYTQEEVYEMLRTKGSLMLSDFNPIDIEIVYVPGDGVDTSYLYTLYDELSYEGKEVICVIQDYIKRIRSVKPTNGDIRLELGEVINEFKVFAGEKDIPIITASQLNRDAVGKVDDTKRNGNATNSDLVRLFGRQNIGESMLILENIDCAFAIAKEFDAEGHKYLGINKLKARFRSLSTLSCIHQPYVTSTGIKLLEDAYAQVPAYKLTLEDRAPRLTGRSSYPAANEIVAFENVALNQTPDNTGNLFSSMSAASSISSLEKRTIIPIIKAS